MWMSVRLFLEVPWVGLRSVIVSFPGHTHLFFKKISMCFVTMKRTKSYKYK